MIGAVNNSQYQSSTNFRAIVPVRGIHVNGALSSDEKQWGSAVNHTINALMKRDKSEPQNIDVQKINGAIRAKFQSRIADYVVPPSYGYASRTLSDTPRFLVRSIENNRNGIQSLYLLTGEHARRLEKASLKVKDANSIKDNPHKRERELRIAKEGYGDVVKGLLGETHFGLPSIEIFGKKEKSGKITPTDITF